MKLLDELKEASVAATGHHADLLRRAAEYVEKCEGQEPVAWLVTNYWDIEYKMGMEKSLEYSPDRCALKNQPLYLHPSPPQSEEIAELRRQVFSYESMVADRESGLRRCSPIIRAANNGQNV